jgi:hypothetical protein
VKIRGIRGVFVFEIHSLLLILHGRVDLAEELLVCVVLQRNRRSRAHRVAQAIPLAEHRIDHRLPASRRLPELDRAIGANRDAGAARDALLLLHPADRPGGRDRVAREQRHRPSRRPVRLADRLRQRSGRVVHRLFWIAAAGQTGLAGTTGWL